MLVLLALSGSLALQWSTDAHDARLVGFSRPARANALSDSHTQQGPTDAHDARLVGFSRPARACKGQLLLMMLASSGSHAQQGPTDAHDAQTQTQTPTPGPKAPKPQSSNLKPLTSSYLQSPKLLRALNPKPFHVNHPRRRVKLSFKLSNLEPTNNSPPPTQQEDKQETGKPLQP